MSNKVRYYYCGHEFNEDELLKSEIVELDNVKEICPNYGKDVFYDLKEVGGETLTFATRV